LLEQISYKEAIEMAFYGASVIHSKTLKPLENKNIPLYVRSFYNLDSKGTIVSKGHDLIPEIPCFILKQRQILVSISALDFSFMVENNLSDIFKILHIYKLKVNLIQNSALSFSVCIEDKYTNFQNFLSELKLKYKVNYFEGVSLYTVRHANDAAIQKIEQKGNVLLKQVTKGTVQVIMQ
jgi:aspartate kinase